MFPFLLGKEARYRKILNILNDHKALEHGVMSVLPRRLPPERQVIQMITMDCQNMIRQVQESAAIIETTSSPDVFYGRADLLLRNLRTLIEVEKLWPGLFKSAKPSKIFQKLDTEGFEAEVDMWHRFFDEAQIKASHLKTEKGRTNALNRAIETAGRYDGSVSPQASDVIFQRISTIHDI